MTSPRICAVFVAFLVLGGCGGETDDDDELVIDDTESALVENADDAPADDGCRDGDHNGHKRHHRHWFKILDLLDGTRDKAITLAELPDGLVKKLTRMDANADGIVTKKEVKRALKRHRHHDGDD